MKSKFLRDIATLVSGTAAAQVASILFIPWITRLYGPEAFGGFGYFSSMLGFLTPLAGLCFPLAVVLPKRIGEARLLIDMSLKIALCASFFIFLFMLIIENINYNLIPFSMTYVFIPLGLFLTIVVLVYTQWSIRLGHYKLVAAISVLSSVLGGVLKVALGYFYPNSISLILVANLILFFNALVLVRRLGVPFRSEEFFSVRVRHWMVAKKYRRFPLFRTPHSVLATISQIAPIFLLTSFYDAKYAGYFVLTRSVLSAPVSLIGKAVYDAAYPRISQRYNKNQDNFGFILKLSIGLGGISVIPLICIFFAGDSMFSLIFGAEWERAGEYAAWMALWFAFNFSNKAVAAAVSVYGMDNFLFRNGILNMLLSLLGFFVGFVYCSSDLVSVALFSLFGIICQCLLIVKVLRVVKRSDLFRFSGAGLYES